MKICRKCQLNQKNKEFYSNKNSKDGLSPICKVCDNQIRKLSYYKKRDLELQKDARAYKFKQHKINERFNISLDEYKRLMEEDFCHICRKTNQSNRDFHIDHCHKTNIVRGVLCSNCNTALGLLKENPDIILNALKYIVIFEEE